LRECGIPIPQNPISESVAKQLGWQRDQTFDRSLAPNFLQSPISISLAKEPRSFSGSSTSSKHIVKSRTKALNDGIPSCEKSGMMVSVGTVAGLAGLLLKIPIFEI
jgi:hypothetical protein